MRSFLGLALALVLGAGGGGLALGAGCSDDGDDATPTASTEADGAGLYTRLGGHAGIAGAVDRIVAAELQDPEVAPFFVFASSTGAAHAPPDVAQIKECLVLLLGQAAGGPESYPATVSGGFVCRSMKEAHENLHVPGATFDEFVRIASASLRASGVSDADITALGQVLNATRDDVVDPNAAPPDGGT